MHCQHVLSIQISCKHFWPRQRDLPLLAKTTFICNYPARISAVHTPSYEHTKSAFSEVFHEKPRRGSVPFLTQNKKHGRHSACRTFLFKLKSLKERLIYTYAFLQPRTSSYASHWASRSAPSCEAQKVHRILHTDAWICEVRCRVTRSL